MKTLKMQKLAALLFVACCMACGNKTTEADLQEIIEAAQACQPGDTCVLAGASQCSCPQPVNSDDEDVVNQAASELDCDDKTVKCQGYINPRCESRCVADPG